ncbi:MAG: ABC transporter permease [Paludibacteraceae bacterium]|nr:ABC transporter permease [Paludibacteraceae bacterium]
MAKFELFIANRFNREERDNQQMSRPAVRIAIIGISLGLAVMLISIAVIVGFKREVRNQIIGFGSHIQIMSYNNYNSLQSEPVTLTPQLDSLLKTTPNISDIQHIATQPGIIHTEEAFQGILLKGVDSTYNWDFFSQNLLEGATLNSQSSTPNSSLISASIAQAMNLKTGDSYTVYFASNNGLRARKFTVLGIYQTTFADYDKLYIITDINHIQRLNQWGEDQFSTLEILINDYTQLNQTSAELFNRIITYSHNTDILYRVETIESLTPQIFDWLAMLDMNAIVIIILMLAVSGFCVISGLLILILERSATIGLLKSLGANNWTIRKIFLTQSAYLISRGMLWGNIIGLSTIAIQHFTHAIPLDPTSYYVDHVPVTLPLTAWLLINIGLATASILMLVGPSYFVTRISPAEAMRKE